jgi:hypothetical protein
MPNIQPGDLVVLISVPPGLIAGLPEEDQTAIRSVIGKPVKFAGMVYGQAELEFKDTQGAEHTIWVDTDQIRPA